VTTKGTFLWSLDEIGLVVYEEMSFKVKVYGRTTDGRTTDAGRKAITKAHPVTLWPCHFVTGELKIQYIFISYFISMKTVHFWKQFLSYIHHIITNYILFYCIFNIKHGYTCKIWRT
jgi:hypothetical protein